MVISVARRGAVGVPPTVVSNPAIKLCRLSEDIVDNGLTLASGLISVKIRSKRTKIKDLSSPVGSNSAESVTSGISDLDTAAVFDENIPLSVEQDQLLDHLLSDFPDFFLQPTLGDGANENNRVE